MDSRQQLSGQSGGSFGSLDNIRSRGYDRDERDAVMYDPEMAGGAYAVGDRREFSAKNKTTVSTLIQNTDPKVLIIVCVFLLFVFAYIGIATSWTVLFVLITCMVMLAFAAFLA